MRKIRLDELLYVYEKYIPSIVQESGRILLMGQEGEVVSYE